MTFWARLQRYLSDQLVERMDVCLLCWGDLIKARGIQKHTLIYRNKNNDPSESREQNCAPLEVVGVHVYAHTHKDTG